MNVKIKKSLRDLLGNPSRTILVVLALVIGLWGIGSIIVSYFILQNDLNENFLRTKPAHVVMTSKDFHKLELEMFNSKPGVESAEFRDLSKGRIEIRPNKWIDLWVFGVNDFHDLRLAKFYQEQGKKVPDTDTMLIERDGQKISNLKLGSVARIRNGKGKRIEASITGITFDPVLAPSSQDHRIHSYVDKKTFTKITGNTANERLVFRLNNVSTKKDIQIKIKTILDDFRLMDVQVNKVMIPKLNEHPHQFQLNTLLFLEGGIGLLAFLMGIVLVWQMMSAILAQQVRQIGILKAIGANRVQVFYIFLTMVLLLGVAACLIAVPLAVVSGYAFADFVAGQLNFEVLSTTLPIYVYLYLIAAGILMPVLASFPALLKGTGVSAYEAMTDYGIQQNKVINKVKKKHSIFDWFPISRTMRLAYRNTMRRKKRLAVILITLALGVAIFSTGFNVRQAIIVLLWESGNALKYDVQLSLKQPITPDKALRPFQSLANVSRIETWSGGHGVIQSKGIETTDEATIFALTHDTDLLKLEIIQGRWLQESNDAEIVVNQKVLETFDNPVIGEYYLLKVKGKSLKVKLVGVVKEFAMGRIYIDQEKCKSMFGSSHLVSHLMFVAKDRGYKQVLALEKDIEKAISPSALSVSNVESHSGRMKILYDHLHIILYMLLVMALMVLVVGALGMASAMGINIMERTREIGVLRAIGAIPKKIYSIFVLEGMLISIASIILGLLIAWPLSIVASEFFGKLIIEYPFKFAFSHLGFWITLVVTFSFVWLASRVPAAKAIKISTQEALSYE